VRSQGARGSWSSTSTRAIDGAVESVQRMTFPRPVVEHTPAGARRLGDLYWHELRRVTLGLVQTTVRNDELEMCVLGRGPALLRFGLPEAAIDSETVSCSYPIHGGLLARAPAGSLSFTQQGVASVAVTSAVEGFLPRLGVLYAPVQSRLHVALGRRYFSRLGRQAPG
jgi:hypothetical protein